MTARPVKVRARPSRSYAPSAPSTTTARTTTARATWSTAKAEPCLLLIRRGPRPLPLPPTSGEDVLHRPGWSRARDHRRRAGGEPDRGPFILGGERGSELFGEVDIAGGLAVDLDRSAEEAVHFRVSGREAVGSRVGCHVLQAQRLRVGEERPSRPRPRGGVAMLRCVCSSSPSAMKCSSSMRLGSSTPSAA